jgi:photoactive yellow protein
MPDPARDLYSFLRSKDFINSDDDSGGDDEGDDSPRLRAVDGFDGDADDADPSSASSGNSSAGDSLAGASSAGASSAGDLSFHDDNVGEKLRNVDAATLNSVEFGIIQVSDDGEVQFFNEYESNLSGVDPDDAIGKNFFTELAPCSNNRLFRGRFKSGIRTGEMDEQFNYTYTYKMRPTLVDVRLYRDDAGNNWILVKKR